MFKRFGHNSPTPIGLDIGSRCLKAVQLRRIAGTPARWKATAATALPRDPSFATAPTTAEAARWVDVLERQGFRGRRVVVGLPVQRLIVSPLELPPRASGAPVEQLARAEVARASKCAPDAMELAIWDLPSASRTTKGTQLMAVGCAHAQAAELIEPLESAGFDVCALDAQFLAAARGAADQMGADDAITAMLDIGWNDSALVLFHGRTAIYTRLLPETGVGQLIAELTDRLHIDPEVAEHLLAEAGSVETPDGVAESVLPAAGRGILASHVEQLSRDLKASFAYASHQYPQASVAKLLLVGGGATRGLTRAMAQELEIQVEVAAGSAGIERAAQFASFMATGALTTAIGLAMHPEV